MPGQYARRSDDSFSKKEEKFDISVVAAEKLQKLPYTVDYDPETAKRSKDTSGEDEDKKKKGENRPATGGRSNHFSDSSAGKQETCSDPPESAGKSDKSSGGEGGGNGGGKKDIPDEEPKKETSDDLLTSCITHLNTVLINIGKIRKERAERALVTPKDTSQEINQDLLSHLIKKIEETSREVNKLKDTPDDTVPESVENVEEIACANDRIEEAPHNPPEISEKSDEDEETYDLLKKAFKVVVNENNKLKTFIKDILAEGAEEASEEEKAQLKIEEERLEINERFQEIRDELLDKIKRPEEELPSDSNERNRILLSKMQYVMERNEQLNRDNTVNWQKFDRISEDFHKERKRLKETISGKNREINLYRCQIPPLKEQLKEEKAHYERSIKGLNAEIGYLRSKMRRLPYRWFSNDNFMMLCTVVVPGCAGIIALASML